MPAQRDEPSGRPEGDNEFCGRRVRVVAANGRRYGWRGLGIVAANGRRYGRVRTCHFERSEKSVSPVPYCLLPDAYSLIPDP